MASSNKKLKSSIESLPEELILEIFVKLPPKVVHRSKTVCKRWLSLVSHPSFPRLYALGSKLSLPTRSFYFPTISDNLGFSLHHITSAKNTPHPSFAFNFLPEAQAVMFLGSSNGLVFLQAVHNYSCYVCNPITKKFISLPLPPNNDISPLTGIVHKPYDSFQVVKIFPTNEADSNSLILYVFDSRTARWKELKVTFSSRVRFNETRINAGIEYKGVLHWQSGLSGVIFAFEPYSDLYRLIQMPGDPSHDNINGRKSCIGVSQGNLHFVQLDSYTPSWTSWRLVDYEAGKWCLDQRYCCGDQNPYYHHYPFSFSYWQLLAIDPFDSNNFYLYASTRGRKRISCIVSYNAERRKMEKLYRFMGSRFGQMASMFEHPIWPTSIPEILKSS